MPLYEVGKGPYDILRNPSKIRDSDILHKLHNEKYCHPRTLARMFKTIDEELTDLCVRRAQKLIWTKTGALIGFDSIGPKKHIDHLWRNLECVFGDGKEILLAAGVMVLWEISKRPEIWVMFKEVRDEIDPDTGKKITIAHYWVDDTFVPNLRPKKERVKKATFEDLKKKWSALRR